MDRGSSSYHKRFSKNRSSTSFDDLPDGLDMDILSRLPVKTLVQSTSVCKTWYSIIKSHSFISAHFSRSIANPSNNYIFLFHTFSSLVNVLSDNHLLTRKEDFNVYLETESKTQQVIDTCNGLICLTDYGGEYYGRDIYLFNPFIRKHKKLAVESSCYADLIAQINTGGDIQVSFGCSEVENDYKVVRIINHYSDVKRSVCTTKVEIYSLKSGTWKCIDASFEILPSNISPVFVHGCLYWGLLGTVQPDDQTVGHLLCFDLNDEVFRQIKLPTVFFKHYFNGSPTILAKNGSVAVALDPGENHTSMKFCLLVLENGIGGEVLWKEFYYDNIDIDPVMCMGFSVCGRLIFLDWDCPTWIMVAVDLDHSCAIEKLALDCSNRFTEAMNVMESLILFSD